MSNVPEKAGTSRSVIADCNPLAWGTHWTFKMSCKPACICGKTRGCLCGCALSNEIKRLFVWKNKISICCEKWFPLSCSFRIMKAKEYTPKRTCRENLSSSPPLWSIWSQLRCVACHQGIGFNCWALTSHGCLTNCRPCCQFWWTAVRDDV